MKTAQRPKQMIVFIAEDSHSRARFFKDWCPPTVRPVIASDAATAIKMLREDGRTGDYGAIMLDFDLHQQNRGGLPVTQLKTGREVAQQILQSVERHVPIFVHSMNPAGHEEMRKMLTNAGFTVTCKPFADLSSKEYRAWIREAEAGWLEDQED